MAVVGYEGGKIADLVDRAQTGARLAGESMAKDGGSIMTREAKKNTPVRTRHLRDDIHQKKTLRVTATGLIPQGHSKGAGWQSGAETDVSYAPEMEYGSGLWGPKHKKFEIRPKKPGGVLVFRGKPIGNAKEGNMVFTTLVHHPGSPGHHMFAIGAAMAEASMQQIGHRGMRVMRRYVEHL